MDKPTIPFADYYLVECVIEDMRKEIYLGVREERFRYLKTAIGVLESMLKEFKVTKNKSRFSEK